MANIHRSTASNAAFDTILDTCAPKSINQTIKLVFNISFKYAQYQITILKTFIIRYYRIEFVNGMVGKIKLKYIFVHQSYVKSMN